MTTSALLESLPGGIASSANEEALAAIGNKSQEDYDPTKDRGNARHHHSEYHVTHDLLVVLGELIILLDFLGSYLLNRFYHAGIIVEIYSPKIAIVKITRPLNFKIKVLRGL